MKFLLKFLIVILFINFHTNLYAEVSIRYVNLDSIFINSNIGKKINKKITEDKKSKIDQLRSIEKDLTNKKNKILSKQNVLEKKQFEAEVISHQENVKKYELKKSKEIKELNIRNNKIVQNFMKKVDQIMKQYAKDNSIDLILKQDILIVSNTNLDITKNIIDEVNKQIKKID